MIKIRNNSKQAVVLEVKHEGKIVGMTIPSSRAEVVIADDQMTQDILIKSERGIISYSHVAEVSE